MMTKRDKEVLNFIVNYALREGVLPTFEEIGEGVNLKSKSTIHTHVHKLEKEGYLEFHGARYKVKGIHYERDAVGS